MNFSFPLPELPATGFLTVVVLSYREIIAFPGDGAAL